MTDFRSEDKRFRIMRLNSIYGLSAHAPSNEAIKKYYCENMTELEKMIYDYRIEIEHQTIELFVGRLLNGFTVQELATANDRLSVERIIKEQQKRYMEDIKWTIS